MVPVVQSIKVCSQSHTYFKEATPPNPSQAIQLNTNHCSIEKAILRTTSKYIVCCQYQQPSLLCRRCRTYFSYLSFVPFSQQVPFSSHPWCLMTPSIPSGALSSSYYYFFFLSQCIRKILQCLFFSTLFVLRRIRFIHVTNNRILFFIKAKL